MGVDYQTIWRETVAGAPPSDTSKDAMRLRDEITSDVAYAKKRGWIVDCPHELTDRGATDNAFCATGPGGGVDPSCSPGSHQYIDTAMGDHVRVEIDPDKTTLMEMLDRVPRDLGIKGFVFGGHTYVFKTNTIDEPKQEVIHHDHVFKAMGLAKSGGLPFDNEFRIQDLHDTGPTVMSYSIKAKAIGSPMRKFADHVGMAFNSFCPTGEGGGVDPSCSPGGHAHEALAEAGEVGESAHELHELIGALGGDPHELVGLGGHHVLGTAVDLAAKAVALIPGGRRAAEAITAAHKWCEDKSSEAVEGMEARYGKATTAAILGAGAIVSSSVIASAGLPHLAGNLIPGRKLIGAIPLVALAEVGRAAGHVHGDSDLEKHCASAGRVLHAIGHAIGSGVEAAKAGGLRAAREAGRAVGAGFGALSSTVPATNVDIDAAAKELVEGLYKDYAEYMKEHMTRNFNPNHDEKGEFSSGEGGGHHADPAHALEHTGHELHQAHEIHEVIEALAGHGHESVLGVGAHEVVGDAVKLAAKAIAKAPGGRAVAEYLTDMHDGARDLAEKLTKDLQDRYGHATAAAILGSGAVAAAATRASVGLSGPLGNIIPGQKFIGAIPIVALAEAGRVAGLVGPDSKLEQHIGTAAKWVHAVREAIGRPVKAAGEAVKDAGLKAAHGAGKLTGKLLRSYGKTPTTPVLGNVAVDIDKEAEALVARMYEGYADKVKKIKGIRDKATSNANPNHDAKGRFAAAVEALDKASQRVDEAKRNWQADSQQPRRTKAAKELMVKRAKEVGAAERAYQDAYKEHQEAKRAVENADNRDYELAQAGAALSKDPDAMPGYGQIFRRMREVWYVGGDGDSRGFEATVKEMLGSVPGVDTVTYESESFPPKGEGWVQVFPITRNANPNHAEDGRFATADSTAEHLKDLHSRSGYGWKTGGTGEIPAPGDRRHRSKA